MEINILKEIQFYIKNWLKNLKTISLFILCAIIFSIITTPKYTTEFSLYQKNNSELGILSAFSDGTETIGLDSLIESKQLLVHLASKKWNNKKLWEIFGTDKSIKNKIIDSLFRKKLNHESLYFDRSIKKLDEDILDTRYNLENKNVEVRITYKDRLFAESLANEIINFVNQYYSKINNEVAIQRNQYIKVRLNAIEEEIEEDRNNLVLFKEKNKNISSPQLLEELQRLESQILLKTSIYSQLFGQYELKLLESIDQSNSVFLITEPYTMEKPSSPNIRFNILIAIMIGLIFTFIYSIRINNDQSSF